MPAADFTFSGDTKRIIITSGVTSVDVQDMYSRWKDWTTEGDNSKYLQALRTFGGDPTIAGQFAPRYFFLTNGWRVEVNSGEVDFGVNLYTDELESPVLVGDGAVASIRNSDAVNVETSVSQALDYDGKVTINSTIGVSGTTYPIGTTYQPVNNLADAKIIANNYGLHEYHIFGTTIFNVDLEGSTVFGGNIRDVVVFQNVNVDGTTFKECVLSGTYQGFIAGETVQLADGLSGMSGVFKDSGILGRLYISASANTSILNCSSMVPGNISPSIFMNNNVSLNFRKYSGGIAIYDCGSGSTATFEFLAGNCRILSGCTGGEIEVRGIAKFTDQSSGTTVGIEGLLIPSSVARQHSLNINTEITRNN